MGSGQVHNVLVGVQKAVYHYEGSVNKFLMDDKGSTLIACFGLSPVSHTDDALRAVLSALYICERLFDLSFPASVRNYQNPSPARLRNLPAPARGCSPPQQLS